VMSLSAAFVAPLLLLAAPDFLGASPQEARPDSGKTSQASSKASDDTRGSRDHSIRVGPRSKWWDDTATAQRFGLTTAQQRKMDEVFDKSRPQLIDLVAALEKQQAIIDPLLSANHLDEPAVLAQIDRVVTARAALERANSVMLLDLRKVLTADQWRRLQSEDHKTGRHENSDRRER
jgi:Spy/CpxP family protein refolding chaperone